MLLLSRKIVLRKQISQPWSCTIYNHSISYWIPAKVHKLMLQGISNLWCSGVRESTQGQVDSESSGKVFYKPNIL